MDPNVEWRTLDWFSMTVQGLQEKTGLNFGLHKSR